MPIRIQLSRAKGWRKPEGAVKVDRSTKWGNPFRPAPMPPLGGDHQWRKAEPIRRLWRCVDDFRRALEEGELPVTVQDVQRELRGKDLACWCGPEGPCHADVLLDVANR